MKYLIAIAVTIAIADIAIAYRQARRCGWWRRYALHYALTGEMPDSDVA